MAYDDPYEPLPMPAPYADPWSHIHDDPWSRLPQRDVGVDPPVPTSADEWQMYRGPQPEMVKKKRPAWLDRLGAIGDLIADAIGGRKPYFMRGDPGDAPRLGGGGGGMSASGVDFDKPGHLEMLGNLYLKQLAAQIAGEAMRKGEPMRSYYRPSGGGEGARRG